MKKRNQPEPKEVWLKSMISTELDLLYPSKKADNQFIFDHNGWAVAFSSLSSRSGGFSELTTVVVDPKERGKGISQKIVERCRGPTLVYTRHPALAKTLLRNGFSKKSWAGLSLSISVGLNRVGKFAYMLRTLQFRRMFHMATHLFAYKLYIKK